MPSISRIRFTNVIYDGGHKRYIDTTFRFDGYNGILLLENGAGKTVFVQTLIQAVLPRKTVAQRKIQETLQLNNAVAHIAVEWILEDQPRRYALTAVSLFMNSKEQLGSQEFALEYTPSSQVRLDTLPFVRREKGTARPATKEEMAAYYRGVAEHNMAGRFFSENETRTAYGRYLEEHFKIIPSEWNKIAAINETEGGVEGYFENCRTTNELVDRLLIPTVEEGVLAAAGQNQGDNGFASLFESQREHVRQQLRLEKRIAEMKGVLDELKKYTALQKGCFDAEEGLCSLNSQLKAYYGQIGRQEEKRQHEAADLEQQGAVLEKKRADTEQLLAACDVADAREAAAAAGLAAQQAQKAADAAKAAKAENIREWQNLELARHKQLAAKNEALLKEREQALAALDAAANTQQLLTALTENSACLHGWFEKAEAAAKGQLQQIAAHQQEIRQKQAALTGEQAEQEKACRQILREIQSGEGRIAELLRQQEKLESRLFDDALHQDARDVQRRWQQDLKEKGREAEDYEKNRAFYESEGEKAAAALPDAEKEEAARQETLRQTALSLKAVDTLADGLRERLQHWPHCANIASDTSSLYRRADALSRQVGDDLVILETRRRDLDWKRRQAYRWLDIYGGEEQFLADPVLADKIDAWSSDFFYLKSGAELFRTYSVTADGGADALYSRYPFWAASVVTTADELPQLTARLQKAAPDFFQPVFILTEVEVRRLVAGEAYPLPTRQIVPKYWQNVAPEKFTSWRDALQEAAERADAAMAENDRAVAELRPLAKDLQAFYQAHPFGEYRDLTETQRRLQEESEKARRFLETARQTVEQCRRQAEQYKSRLLKVQQEKKELERRLESLADYLALQAQHRAILEMNGGLQKRLGEMQQSLDAVAEEAARLQAQYEDTLCRQSRSKARLSQLHETLYWQEVQETAPAVCDKDYDVLAEERRRLKSRLDGANENRGRLEAQLEAARREAARLEEDIKRLRDTAETALDEDFTYPEDGAERSKALLKARPDLIQNCEKAAQACQKARSAYDRAQGRQKTEEDRYQRRYETMPAFTGPIRAVREEAEQQAKKLADASRETARRQKEALAEGKKLSDLRQNLDVKNERLLFAADDVPRILVDGLEALTTAGALEKAVLPLLEAAEAARQRVLEAREESEKGRETLTDYCEKNLNEPKLRSSITDGLRYKKAYQDYRQWQDKIRERLEKAIAIAEEERKSHYAHLEHMLSHMILHLQNVCDGLKELGAKTRIKIGETTKDIFQIQVPPWQEETARTEVRRYLDDLTKELDKAADDEGDEPTKRQKYRAFLEKRLRTQQVLRCILGSQAVKVRCRKATSGNTFSERPFSWEESNKWSGGEMWSKNMALFLGCLNYLSEKRCHIRKAKYNTRVVIADNPFGKASSDHVLSPVFFIAKQLGFQIIALTAHQEGSFIRKYFPVVYSCRFAEMANKKGQVLVPDKEIKTAFFEEHHPESLARLDEYEQLGLF